EPERQRRTADLRHQRLHQLHHSVGMPPRLPPRAPAAAPLPPVSHNPYLSLPRRAPGPSSTRPWRLLTRQRAHGPVPGARHASRTTLRARATRRAADTANGSRPSYGAPWLATTRYAYS